MSRCPYPERLARILADLSLLQDRMDRIHYLISVAERFEEVPARLAVRPFAEAHRVQHCESEAFVWAEARVDGTIDYHFAVENPQGISAKALAVVLAESLSGAPLDQVLAVSPDVVYELFGRELSMGKSMGLTGMVQLLHHLTLAHQKAGVASG